MSLLSIVSLSVSFQVVKLIERCLRQIFVDIWETMRLLGQGSLDDLKADPALWDEEKLLFSLKDLLPIRTSDTHQSSFVQLVQSSTSQEYTYAINPVPALSIFLPSIP
ncbi:hypothetical protein BKA67DRAFT_537858 [Truncatella angustata]|uniref:Uncharacterized protein n=1 Tax=Truncatella angustata TaxID=152316 RepID=A0A9P8UGQ1_9PEZI|nr:uncharacterized protein BKA67DRAFT_537858 [Truncatella angustata]KAH6652012.1 hypothetical protein BKA67DRAFT_537858 [Truncatella angustata]